MTDSPADQEPPAWDFRETGMIILSQDLSWDEWSELWARVQGLHRSAPYWVGDVLILAQDKFPDIWSQALDKHNSESYSNAMRVCRKVPFARRRAELSFSHHREVAALPEDEQTSWLEQAVANDWKVRDLAEEIRKAREARSAYPSNGGPPSDEPSTWRTDEGDADGAAPEKTPAEALERNNRLPAPIPLQTAFPHAARDGPVTAEAIRLVIARLRAVAPALAIGEVDTPEMTGVEDAVLGLMGQRPGPRSILHDDTAIRTLVPAGWRQRYEDDGTQAVWTVELRRGEQMGIAIGPHLSSTLLEAILAAMISDLGGE